MLTNTSLLLERVLVCLSNNGFLKDTLGLPVPIFQIIFKIMSLKFNVATQDRKLKI